MQQANMNVCAEFTCRLRNRTIVELKILFMYSWHIVNVSLPVVTLAISKADENQPRGYHHGANACMVETVRCGKFSEAVRIISLFR